MSSKRNNMIEGIKAAKNERIKKYEELVEYE